MCLTWDKRHYVNISRSVRELISDCDQLDLCTLILSDLQSAVIDSYLQ
jgi:hypothetical protein